MDMITVELQFPPKQVTQLDEIARTRQIVLTEAIQLAVIEWLEEQDRLTQVRVKKKEESTNIHAKTSRTYP